MNIYSIILLFVLIVLIALFIYIHKRQKKSQLSKIFIVDIILMFLQCLCVFMQSILVEKNVNINTIFKVEYITYIANAFIPIALLFIGLIFANTKVSLKRIHLLLFVVPILSLLLLWTNDFHHLFYINYSINYSEIVYGFYLKYIYTTYTYSLLLIGIYYLLKYSIKNAGFFSKQSMLLVIGSSIPLVANILGTFNIIPMSIYITPICFAFTILFYALAIFKFNFLGVAPIAMQTIVDRMSDSFLVINEDGIITDFNNTFLKIFKFSASSIRNDSFLNFLYSNKLEKLASEFKNSIFDKCKTSEETLLVRREMKIKDKYFNIEVSGIFSKNNFLGTLILLKDVTQHVIDRNTIKDNQSMLMEKERLASLGQMIGGIAHILKTPIMYISGAAE